MSKREDLERAEAECGKRFNLKRQELARAGHSMRARTQLLEPLRIELDAARTALARQIAADEDEAARLRDEQN